VKDSQVELAVTVKIACDYALWSTPAAVDVRLAREAAGAVAQENSDFTGCGSKSGIQPLRHRHVRFAIAVKISHGNIGRPPEDRRVDERKGEVWERVL